MCLDEFLQSLAARPVSRRGFLSAGAGLGLTAAVLDQGRGTLLPGVAAGAQLAPPSGGPGGAGLNFKWLGTASSLRSSWRNTAAGYPVRAIPPRRVRSDRRRGV